MYLFKIPIETILWEYFTPLYILIDGNWFEAMRKSGDWHLDFM